MKSPVFIFVILACVTGTAWAQAPDPILSHATCDDITPRSILSVPNGAGDAMEMARIYGGGFMDATITVTLIDGNGMPVSGYPSEDIWLDVLDPGVGDYTPCPAGNIADGATNALGQTTFSNTLSAGGSGSGAQVMIGTWPTPEFPIPFAGGDLFHFNSPDINGDLQVNLSDIALFAGDYYGAYNYRSDYYWDGVVNLSDIGFMAQGVGASCP
jgi:hypothetical protein